MTYYRASTSSSLYIIGVPGTGKSGLLVNLIDQESRAGNATIVIDPHGDLTADYLAQLKPQRVAATYMLDMQDEAYPFGVNLFAGAGHLKTGIARTHAVERVMHIFELNWPEVKTQQYMGLYLRIATIVMLHVPGSTLVDLQRFFRDDTFRADLLGKLKNMPDVIDFWHGDWDALSDSERARHIQPLRIRLSKLFDGRQLIRNILGQRENSVDFRRAIEDRETIFIKLPTKLIEEDARLFGTIMVAQIAAAVFSFADIPTAERPGVSLYIDEFQHFVTKDIEELFTEGRKFGVRLTVAHQTRGAQPPSNLQSATLTARTKVCFQVNEDDARDMAYLFPAQESVDIEPKVAEYLLKYGSDNQSIKTFIEFYLRPMQLHKHGHQVYIQDKQFDFDMGKILTRGAINGGLDKENFFVADPTPYLDNLLYDVMREHNPNKSIPHEAMIGVANFGVANCGKKFYAQGRKISDDVLAPEYVFPPHLVSTAALGGRWLRSPESSSEQLLHFVFTLRNVMAYLAEHPVGTAKPATTASVVQNLTQLPRRAAWVRSGDDVGPKGMRYLQELGMDTHDAWRANKELDKHALFIDHTLELNDVLIAASLTHKANPGFHLGQFTHELVLKRLPVKVYVAGQTIAVIPDAFLIFRRTGTELGFRVLLEHDRGTEEQQHFKRKIRAYIAAMQRQAFSAHFWAELVTVAITTFVGEHRVKQMCLWTEQVIEETKASWEVGSAFNFSALPRDVTPEQAWLEPRWQLAYTKNQQRYSLLAA